MSSSGITTRSRAKRNVERPMEPKEKEESSGGSSKENTKKITVKEKKNTKKSSDDGVSKTSSESTPQVDDTKTSNDSVPLPKPTRGRKKKVNEKDDTVLNSKDIKVEEDDKKGNDESSSKSETPNDNGKLAPKAVRRAKKKAGEKIDSNLEKKKAKVDNGNDNSSSGDTNTTEQEEPPEDPAPKKLAKSRKKKNDVQEVLGLTQKKAKIEDEIKSGEKKKIKMPVDPFATTRQYGWSVFEDNELGPYSVMLNQTDVTNNNNKFIVLQVLKKDSSEEYSFFQRWGRVGFSGQSKLDNGTQLSSIKLFEVKFREKTGHPYKGHIEYEKKPKKYFPIEMKGEEVNSGDEDVPDDIPESKLEAAVKRVMDLICDTKIMADTLKGMNFDLDKMPLGKLTKKQIISGYECLKTIENAITAKNKADIVEGVNKYYTNIPHFFGMRKPKLIETIDDLKKEIELLDALWEIETAMKTMKEEKAKKAKFVRNPMDDLYDKMKCNLKVLPPKNTMRKTIEEVVKNTQGPTHSWYKYNVKNVFEVKRETEDEKFLKDIPGKKLLWHGSRITNWYGILSQGLRIAPKEAPVSGYMFDKGIYMADLSSKSVGYCYANPGQTGFLALVEAAIGNSNVKLNSDCTASKSLSKTQHSVKGEGRMIPEKEIKLQNDVVLYNGPIVDNKSHKSEDFCLCYNEYIVYNTDQVRLRYLVELEFLNQ